MRIKYKYLMLVLILLLTIGFSVTTVMIVMTGASSFGVNNDDFEVYFSKAILNDEDVSTTTISNDKKSITFSTNELYVKGDKSILEFEVTNNSTQYDAYVEMNCSANGTNINEYYKIENNIPDIISSKTTESGNITVTLLKVSLEEITESFVCTINSMAIEKEMEITTTKATINSPNIPGDTPSNNALISWNDKDSSATVSIEDEVSIGTEEFYVIGNVEGKVKLLSKYNLKVGRIYTSSSEYTEIEDTLGIQDPIMVGSPKDNSYPRYGTTIFGTSTSYSGSKVEEYVNNYSNYIKTKLGVENTATLITIEELDDLGCTSASYSCDSTKYKWLHSTSYWTRSTNNNYSVWIFYASGHFGDRGFTSADLFGVRPVVIIDESLI